MNAAVSLPIRSTFERVAEQLAAAFGPMAREVQPRHWLFEIDTGGGRSQLVHVLLEERYVGRNDASRFVVFSPIGPLPRRVDMEGILRTNARLMDAAVCITEFSDTVNPPRPYLMLRTSRLTSPGRNDALEQLIEQIGYTADRLEKDLFAWDRC